MRRSERVRRSHRSAWLRSVPRALFICVFAVLRTMAVQITAPAFLLDARKPSCCAEEAFFENAASPRRNRDVAVRRSAPQKSIDAASRLALVDANTQSATDVAALRPAAFLESFA